MTQTVIRINLSLHIYDLIPSFSTDNFQKIDEIILRLNLIIYQMSQHKFIKAKRWWTIQDCQSQPNYLFVYGDNNVKKGCGGQAIIRNQPNSIGIPTKKYPTNHVTSFYSDNEFDENIKHINDALLNIIGLSTKYDVVIFPQDGLGTGLAQLPTKAPKTYQYLQTKLHELFDINY